MSINEENSLQKEKTGTLDIVQSLEQKLLKIKKVEIDQLNRRRSTLLVRILIILAK